MKNKVEELEKKGLELYDKAKKEFENLGEDSGEYYKGILEGVRLAKENVSELVKERKEKNMKIIREDEIPIIPKKVADFYEGLSEEEKEGFVDTKKILNEAYRGSVGEEKEDIGNWVKGNPEEYVFLAKSIRENKGYLVEDDLEVNEDRYLVVDNEGLVLIKREGFVEKFVGDLEGDIKFLLTENEIKDYDEKYWIFAKKLDKNNIQ